MGLTSRHCKQFYQRSGIYGLLKLLSSWITCFAPSSRRVMNNWSFAISDTERGQLAHLRLVSAGIHLALRGAFRSIQRLFFCLRAKHTNGRQWWLPIDYQYKYSTMRSVSCRAFFTLLSAAFSKKPLLSVGLSYKYRATERVWRSRSSFSRSPQQCPWQAQLPRPQG